MSTGVAEVVKRVSKACADRSIQAAVEAAGPACFRACRGPTAAPRNTSSPCWIRCFEATILGPQAGKPYSPPSGGMNRTALLQIWLAPFASDDPERRGCPALPVPPLPRTLAEALAQQGGGAVETVDS